MNREFLLEKIKAAVDNSGDHPPIVTLEEFFEDNTEEESIAPNNVGYGRPSLGELYLRFLEIRNRPNVDFVFVSIHDEWEEALEIDDLWPAGDCVHIYTSANQTEVENWIAGLKADGAIKGWQRGRGNHPIAPTPNPSTHVYSVVWD